MMGALDPILVEAAEYEQNEIVQLVLSPGVTDPAFDPCRRFFVCGRSHDIRSKIPKDPA
jgi:hypothetical protein